MRLIASSLVVVFVSTALARDIFVNNQSGDDTLTGAAEVSRGRQTGPVRTIAKAMRLAQPGDRVILANTSDPYREQVTIQGGKCSGFDAELPFILDGNGAVLDGTTAVPEDRWQPIGKELFRFAPTIKSTQTLFVDDEPAKRVPLELGATAVPPLQPLEWCLLRGHIYLRTGPGDVPQFHYPSVAGLLTGITIYDVQNVVVRNITVRGFALDGINSHDNAFAVRLEDVTSQDNGRSGFSIGGASRVRVERCIGTGNHVAQLRTEGFSHTILMDCKFDPLAAPAVDRDGGEVLED